MEILTVETKSLGHRMPQAIGTSLVALYTGGRAAAGITDKENPMGFTRRIDIDLPYDQAVTATKAALQEQGFGPLTEIDLRQTLKDKLDVDTDPQVIIGACNPQLAHRALSIDARVATLLPCNVVVRTEHGHTVVEALDPAMMADVSGVPELAAVADDAARRIQLALDTVAKS